MAIDVDAVKSTITRPGDGWSFNLKDSTGLRWITLTYRTEAEAKLAHEQIKAATTGVIDAFIGEAFTR
jgi:hypothetical protein